MKGDVSKTKVNMKPPKLKGLKPAPKIKVQRKSGRGR